MSFDDRFGSLAGAPHPSHRTALGASMMLLWGASRWEIADPGSVALGEHGMAAVVVLDVADAGA
ncbi:MAG TPA: hypothetical protein VNS19_22025, partial [Acidimicrobiales bacterium]|nr:hypothetical protein [Acidimicrobiales bacterium]